MTMRASAALEIRGWHVLTAMIMFFAAIIAINIAFAVVAVESFPGEDVQRSYLQGLNYNQTLAERHAQARMGWRASAALERVGGEVQLVVEMRDAAGKPLDHLRLDAALRWPMDAHHDRALQFTPAGGGVYRASLGVLAVGQWRLRARALNEQGQALDFESDLTWPR